MAIDTKIFQLFHSLAGRYSLADIFVEFFSKYFIYVLIIAFLYVFMHEKKWRMRMYCASLTILSLLLSRGLIAETIRFFFPRQRPFVVFKFTPLISHDMDASFPSGHAAFLFALVPVAFMLSRKFGYWFTGLSAVAVLSRVVAGVHWPSDVLGGVVIGLVGFWIIKKILPTASEGESVKIPESNSSGTGVDSKKQEEFLGEENTSAESLPR